MDINCASMQILTKSYFNKSMSPTIKDVVLSHVINCKECQKFYKKYAKDIGLEFDIKKDSAVFILEGKNCERTEKEFNSKYGKDKLKDYELNWEYYAHKLDLKKLMNLKCVNDFTQETFEVDETDPMCIEAYTAFGRFVTMELCKKVDSLERCYNMEIKKKMRNLNEFDAVFVDLDDTLIHGFMTDLMDITWKRFKNQNIATLLATIQSKFKLYTINHKLMYMLNNCNKPIYILTARKPLKATFDLVQDILPKAILIEMSSQCPYVDKVEYIRDKDYEKTIIFDDNKYTRLNADLQDILAIDPTPMFEEVIE